MKIDVVQNQIQGGRDYQQDSLAQRDIEGFKLLILADGMGGYNGGEIASQIVVDTFMTHPFFNENDFLEDALSSANKKISEYKELHSDVSNMGTTVIAVLLNETSYRWISVGDSPFYLIRNNEIKRLNENHSVAGMLNTQVQKGEISKEKAEENRNRHMLTSAILGEEIFMIDISPVYPFEIDDKLVLASDGIETLSESDILKIISSNSNDLLACQKVLEVIENKNKENQDNATLIIASPLVEKLENSEEQKISNQFILMIFAIVFTMAILLLW